MHPREIKDAFARGENITELLRSENRSDVNTEEIIETAYDLQAGAYVANLKNAAFHQHKVEYGQAIADQIMTLMPKGGSILEPGVGEGTTLSFVANANGAAFPHIHGFDISWSRVARCRSWLQSQNLNDVYLSIASIFHAPYRDNSFDVVYTSHTMEPNGGSEVPILKELYRVASRYLILFEPGFELATPEVQARMRRLGYVTGLKDHATSLGMKVLKHELLPETGDPLNPTVVIVIEKDADAPDAIPQLACPRYGDALQDGPDSLYSPGSLRAYPKIQGIPCLRETDGIVASQYETAESIDS